MDIPMPGGVLIGTRPYFQKDDDEDDDDDECVPLTPRILAETTNLTYPNNDQQTPATRAALAATTTNARESSESNSSSSTAVSAAHNYNSFDDQNRAASYLQFFKSPPEITPLPRSQFQFDVYSTDRTTKTPHHAHNLSSIRHHQPLLLQHQEQQIYSFDHRVSDSPSPPRTENGIDTVKVEPTYSMSSKSSTEDLTSAKALDSNATSCRSSTATSSSSEDHDGSTYLQLKGGVAVSATTTAAVMPPPKQTRIQHLYEHQRHASDKDMIKESNRESCRHQSNGTLSLPPTVSHTPLDFLRSPNLYDDQHVSHDRRSWEKHSPSGSSNVENSLTPRVGAQPTTHRSFQDGGDRLLSMSASDDSSEHFGFLRGFLNSGASTRGVLNGDRNSRGMVEPQDSFSVLSTASRLFGESLVSVSEDGRHHHHLHPSDSSASTPTSLVIRTHSPQQSRRMHTHAVAAAAGTVVCWWQTVRGNAHDVWVRVRAECHDWLRFRAATALQHQQFPLSPRSRNLSDLSYLQAQHRAKCAQMMEGSNSSGTESSTEFFDFVLVLQPQEVYGFWADLLDFRVELLGEEVVAAMDEQWSVGDSSLQLAHSLTTTETSTSDDMASTSDEAPSVEGSEAADTFITTPLSVSAAGIVRRRRTNTLENSSTPLNTTPATTTTCMPLVTSAQTNSRRSMMSPGIYSCFNESTVTAMTAKKQSMFERAVESPSINTSPARSSSIPDTSENALSMMTPATTGLPAYRRRWGNHVQNGPNSMMLSPPVRSLTRQKSMTERRPAPNRLPPPTESAQTKTNRSEDDSDLDHDPNSLRIEDIPNQVVARGIASRTNINGLLPFLSALKRGVVIRRHRPGQEAVFCKLSSTDGGDTINYHTVEYEDAMNAFREQRVRYNRRGIKNATKLAEAQQWSLETSDTVDENVPHNFSVPDYVAAEAYRKRMAKEGSLGRKVTDLATKVVGRGAAKVVDIVAVHPARHDDPRARGEMGSTSLRRSKSDHTASLAFSLVIRNARGNNKTKEVMEDLEAKWHGGDGSESLFRYIDFEAATEGEYWLVFRGLLLLHRDAVVGRFAKQRAAGIGTNAGRLEAEMRDESSELVNRLHQDEFHEPVTVGWLERLIVNWRNLDTTYMEGFITKEGAVPPPSDYFLGFRSPGTAIWSRLRQAGLETHRVYSLDPNRLMIKIRCPSDRLMDVAEVLRMKLKTKEGSFAPFQENILYLFDSMNDPLEGPPQPNSHWPNAFQFRSSIRQKIIAFIIGSRIRDSGAELGQTTDLGQLIQAHVPLHMHDKLDDIYNSWFYFWKVENWSGRTGRILSHAPSSRLVSDNALKESLTLESGGPEHYKKDGCDTKQIPSCMTRFFFGCIHQPLDSIEQYFGEKVAFYFTWLEHTAVHLVFLSIAGLILFFCQLASGKVDHPLRPLFSVVVMMWTFIVLVNWRKRANLMAYRWGTMNYKEQETTRPQFKGDYTQDEITGEWIVTYPKWKRWLKYSISFPLTLFFTSGTLILILLVHANRDEQLATFAQEDPQSQEFHFYFSLSAIGKRSQIVNVTMSKENLRSPEFWFLVVLLPSMLGLFLPLLNFILMRLSIMLNDFENYRTESEYRTYLIIKVFSFRFVCYFATMYYYSIVSIGDEQAIENGILRVGTGILVITTVAQWWQYLISLGFPMLLGKIRLDHRHKRLADELRDIELEEEEICRLSAIRIDHSLKMRQARLINKRLLLEQAQDDTWLEVMKPAHDSFPEYIQAVVQFAFVSCFSVVLPITPLIVLFNYLLSMRLDAYKICKCRRRPLAETTGGIGVWEHVLHIVAVISVLTNCLLIGFTSSQVNWIADSLGEVGLFALIVGWEHVMLLIKYIMSTSMSPFPKSVRDAMKREQYELDKQRNTLMHERRKQQQQHEDDAENGRQFSIRIRRRSARSKSAEVDCTEKDKSISPNSYDAVTLKMGDV